MPDLKIGSLILWTEDNDLGIVLDFDKSNIVDDCLWMRVFWLREGTKYIAGDHYFIDDFEVLN